MKTLHLILLLFLFSFSAMAQELQPVEYADGDQKLNGLVTSNAGEERPGVLILPAWMGIDKEAKNAALALEQEGYIVFIADIFGEGNVPESSGDAAKITKKYKEDYQAYQHRIELAINELKNQGASADKIAVIGYCFGGTGALETARGGLPVQGVVSIHGGLDKNAERENGELKAKILVENPAEDKGVTREIYEALVKELKVGKADWQIITYADSGHTFTDPDSNEYNEVMAKRAWNHTLLFLKEILE